MAVTELPDGRWICYYRIKDDSGKSRIKKEYFGRGADGEIRAQKRNEELDLKKRRPPASHYGPSFGDLAISYARYKNFSANSRKHLKIRLTANILPSLGMTPAVRIRDQDLDRYVEKRRKRVKDSTIKREITDIKAILNWSVKRIPPLIPFNPVRDYRAPREDHELRPPPTVAETGKILAHASPHLFRAIVLAYYLGIRPGAVELLSLSWDHVLWESGTILIRSAHKGGPAIREVPIHEKLLPLLLAWFEKDEKKGPLIHYRKKALKSLKTAWRSTLKRAGISRKLRPYDLRHRFVTSALEEGADIKALSEIVGSSPQTLMRHYQHVSRKMHRKTVAMIPPLELK